MDAKLVGYNKRFTVETGAGRYYLQIASSPFGVTFSQKLPAGKARELNASINITTLSYFSYHTYGTTQAELDIEKTEHFETSCYQAFQGEKLMNRFNAYSYRFLSNTLHNHHPELGHGAIENVLTCFSDINTVVTGPASDVLSRFRDNSSLPPIFPTHIVTRCSPPSVAMISGRTPTCWQISLKTVYKT